MTDVHFGFHVVRRTHHDHSAYRRRCRCARGYEIWCDNKPFITLGDGLALTRTEARTLAANLNGGA